jgi:orotate phosphoribosyltransferase
VLRRRDNLNARWLNYLTDIKVVHVFDEAAPEHVATEGKELHSDTLININAILSSNALLRSLCTSLCEALSSSALAKVEVVVSHEPNGRAIAHEFGSIINRPCGLFDPDSGKWSFSQPRQAQTCLLVLDDLISGGRLRKTQRAIEASGGLVLLPSLCLADLSGGDQNADYSILSAIALAAKFWSPEECPMCKRGSISRHRLDLCERSHT